jgi:hypothetical protein
MKIKRERDEAFLYLLLQLQSPFSLSLSLSHGFTSIYFSVLTPSLYFSMFFTEIFNFAASLTSFKLDFVPMELKIVNKLKGLLVS